MILRKRVSGFSLVELLLVLAIMGILAGIAVPSFLSQRRRARVVGDAQANAASLRMALEQRKADAGVYGAAGTTYAWNSGGFTGSATANPAPTFTMGGTKMTYSVTVGSTGLTYALAVSDPTLSNIVVYRTNQNGSNLYTLH